LYAPLNQKDLYVPPHPPQRLDAAWAHAQTKEGGSPERGMKMQPPPAFPKEETGKEMLQERAYVGAGRLWAWAPPKEPQPEGKPVASKARA